jgi:hypothetical protein
MKGRFDGTRLLDDQPVTTITAFLFHRGGHEDPPKLAENAGKSFQGSIVLGMGFTFDDTDTKGVATPIAEMRRLIEKDSRNQEVIFPYIGGEEVNTSPAHAHHRYVINFGERSEQECRRRWPDLMAIVETKVKGTRADHSTAAWWHFERLRPEMYAEIQVLHRVIVQNCGATPHLALAFIPSRQVLANTLAVFSFETPSAFCALQSRPHEIWARFFGSSMKDDLRYTPSDCFETFPFPENWQTHPALEAAGKTYYEFRATLMVKNNEGLTKTYNRFHDPDERDPDIQKLRDLHSAMDRAVLDAYGWTDIPTSCDFLLDYDIDQSTWGDKKKPYHYRYPDPIRDDLLARLLDLNSHRAKEESLSGANSSKRPKRPRRRSEVDGSRRGLFG